MTEAREFPTAVIASISTGILLCNFSQMHEAAEYLMGHPIWTHHFADKKLVAAMKQAIADQCPKMPQELEGVTVGNYLEHLAKIEADLGKNITIRKGSGVTAMHPLEGIPEHLKDKTIIVETPALSAGQRND